MKKAFLFLLTLALSQAATFHEKHTLSPGRIADPVMVIAVASVTLTEPGTYIAPTWSVFGEIKLEKPGTYTIIAQTGSITFNPSSQLTGPGSLLPSVATFMQAGDFIFQGTTSGSVAIAQGPQPPPEPAPLVNMSIRLTAVENQPVVAGFVVAGKVRRQVLIRAVGPSLANFGISQFLATPTLTLIRPNSLFQDQPNSGWANDSDVAAAATAVGAFPLNVNSRDAAFVQQLDPGAYTVQVTGGSGVVLLEVYYVN